MDKKTTKRAKNAKQKGEISLQQQQQQQQQHVSRFLEAPFVRMLAHAIGELKNYLSTKLQC